MIKRLRDACPGVVFAVVGVIAFASRLTHAPEPVALPTSLLVGLIAVVVVRVVLGALVSGNVPLTMVGIGVGVFEMVFLFRFHVSGSQSQANFIFCGLLDIFVTTGAWLAVRTTRWAWTSQPGVRHGSKIR
jgi:hypothetical protein